MDYLIDYTRITNSGRLTDKFLTAQVRKCLDEKIEKGVVFAMVEITKPWFPNSQIGQKIINSLFREYSKSANTSDLVNFELALKKVNKTLAQITQSGETDWIGNINAVLAVICEKSMHISQTGKGEAFLVRDGKIIHITEGAKNEFRPHPLNTFGDIMSGSIKLGDKLFFTSPEMLNYASQEKIRQIMVSNLPFQAAREISKIIKHEKVRAVNAIVTEIVSKEELANRTTDQTQEVIYLDQNNLENIGEGAKRAFTDFGSAVTKTSEWLGKRFHHVKKYSQEKIVPHLKNTWQKTHQASQKHLANLKAKTGPALVKIKENYQSQFAKKAETKTPTIIEPTKQELPKQELPKKESYSVHHYHKPYKAKLANFAEKINQFFKLLLKGIILFFRWLFTPKNRSIIYILIIIVLAGILVISIGKLRDKQANTQKEEVQRQALTQAEDKLNAEVKLAILYNDKNKALNLLDEIITSSKEAAKYPLLSEEANTLLEKAQVELDKLTSTTRLTNGKTLTQLTNAEKLANSKDDIYNITAGNQIFYWLLADKEAQTAQKLEIPSGNGNANSICQSGEDVLIYTDNQKIFKITNSIQKIDKIDPTGGNWALGNQIVEYFGNIYILNSQQGQIYKHTKTSSGFEKSTDYVDTGTVDIKDAISFSIDGSVYVLAKNGQVVKLAKGKPQTFNVSDIPLPNDKITDPKKIYTDTDASSIYILDGSRIIELDKTGKFLSQFKLKDDQIITDFTIDYKNKKIWALTDNKIILFNY